jgi:hypothetical protein
MKGEIIWGDIEVWEKLELLTGMEALLSVTALEKLGFRVNPRTGELEKSSSIYSDSLLWNLTERASELSHLVELVNFAI